MAKHLKEVLKANNLLNDKNANKTKIYFEDSQKSLEKEIRFFKILAENSVNRDGEN